MKITRISGITAGSNDTLTNGEKIEALYVAGGALLTGSPVIIHFANGTAANRSKTVIASTTAGALAAVGVYEGLGGTGAVTAETLSNDSTLGTGRDALTGDIVYVTVFGEALALVEGTTDVVAGDALTLTTTAAQFKKGAVLAALIESGTIVNFIALEAYTTAGTALCRVLVRVM